MPGWAIWIGVGLGVWLALGVLVALAFGRVASLIDRSVPTGVEVAPARPAARALHADSPRRRILLVDDDPHLRILLRTTLMADEYALEEAGTAAGARQLARFWRPELVVLDLGLPDASGLMLCEELTSNPSYGGPRVVLLTGSEVAQAEAEAAGASAVLRKPYSPLDVIGTIDRVLEGRELLAPPSTEPASDQLLAYAQDLGQVVQSERAQRRLLQQAYRQTVASLTDALEAKNRATGKHALRVHLYALDLTEAVAPGLLDDTSLEYGFLLHDIGKIGIPDALLDKEGPLDAHELRVMRQHPLIGVQLLAEVPLLSGEGLRVVRSHHERWDGHGYPDGLVGKQIPAGARIFAVADALDAMTSERPYRKPLKWNQAVSEIIQESGSQFDPQVVGALARREGRLRRTRHDLAISA